MTKKSTKLSGIMAVVETNFLPHGLTANFATFWHPGHYLGVFLVREFMPAARDLVRFNVCCPALVLASFTFCLEPVLTPSVEIRVRQMLVALAAVFGLHNKKILHG
jgi:hypothetical protein